MANNHQVRSLALKVLSVGAGNDQFPPIKAIKALGYRAVAVDKDPQAIGVEAADVCYPVNFCDIDAVIDFARREKISAVLTTSSGKAIKTVSAVAKALGLKGPSQEAAAITLDKLALKKCLTNQNIMTPPYGEYKARMDIAAKNFPLYLKPVAGIGGKGIVYVGGADSLPAQAMEKAYYWEKYLAGEGISLYGLVSETERCCILAVNKVVTSGPPNFKHRLAALPVTNEFKQLFARIVTALGINFAPFFQIDFIKHNDEFYVIDVGIELDPAVAFILTENFGYDVYQIMIKMAVGEDFDFPELDHITNGLEQ